MLGVEITAVQSSDRTGQSLGRVEKIRSGASSLYSWSLKGAGWFLGCEPLGNYWFFFCLFQLHMHEQNNKSAVLTQHHWIGTNATHSRFSSINYLVKSHFRTITIHRVPTTHLYRSLLSSPENCWARSSCIPLNPTHPMLSRVINLSSRRTWNPSFITVDVEGWNCSFSHWPRWLIRYRTPGCWLEFDSDRMFFLWWTHCNE